MIPPWQRSHAGSLIHAIKNNDDAILSPAISLRTTIELASKSGDSVNLSLAKAGGS